MQRSLLAHHDEKHSIVGKETMTQLLQVWNCSARGVVPKNWLCHQHCNVCRASRTRAISLSGHSSSILAFGIVFLNTSSLPAAQLHTCPSHCLTRSLTHLPVWTSVTQTAHVCSLNESCLQARDPEWCPSARRSVQARRRHRGASNRCYQLIHGSTRLLTSSSKSILAVIFVFLTQTCVSHVASCCFMLLHVASCCFRLLHVASPRCAAHLISLLCE